MFPRLAASALLAGGALLVIVVFGLGLGVLAGMRPGSILDRVISVFSVVTTSIPDFASAVFLSGIFVFWLGLLPGASTMISGFRYASLSCRSRFWGCIPWAIWPASQEPRWLTS